MKRTIAYITILCLLSSMGVAYNPYGHSPWVLGRGTINHHYSRSNGNRIVTGKNTHFTEDLWPGALIAAKGHGPRNTAPSYWAYAIVVSIESPTRFTVRVDPACIWIDVTFWVWRGW